MRRTLTRACVAVACALTLMGVGAYAHARTYARWTVHVRPVCMAAEDSAAHLRLRAYDARTHVARYGCFHAGY